MKNRIRILKLFLSSALCISLLISCSGNGNSGRGEKKIMKIDSITPSGMHIEGKIVNGKKEGVWVISNDTSRIVRKYKEGYKVKERIFINDSLIFEFNK